jgi:hypothetical protein
MRFLGPRRSAALVSLSLLAGACSSSVDLEDLGTTLQDTAGLTEEQAQCVVDEIEASASYTADEINDLADGVVNDLNPPDLTETETEAARQELLDAFNSDVANSVISCGAGAAE